SPYTSEAASLVCYKGSITDFKELSLKETGLVVAKDLSDALAGMNSRGFNISSLYLIGHSEGAHLAGNVGKNLKKSGITISRITGLDPAKPAIENFLKKGDADMVDCVHTDPNSFGTNKAIGDIDFWVNYGCKVQPGCQKNAVPLTPSSLCSHK
ncbi:unnamed protein product, partial [Arctia plantaginis]